MVKTDGKESGTMEVMLRGYSKVDGRTIEIDANDLKGDSGSGGGGGSGGSLLYAEVAITPAEFYNMNAVPKTLVPAIPGKTIFLQTFSLRYKVGTAFSPSQAHLVDLPSGGAILYHNFTYLTPGNYGLNGVAEGNASVGAPGVGAPLQLQIDVPFSVGALSEDAVVMSWYYAI